MEKMSKMCGFGFVVMLLLVVGGVNWGLVGLGGFISKDINVVHMFLGSWPYVEWAVYSLVGVAAIMKIFCWNRCCNGQCSASK